MIPRRVILTGDALHQLRALPSESVDCVITSPPYFGLRDYGTASWTGGDAACDHKTTAAGRVPRPAGLLSGGTATVDAGTIVKGDCRRCGALRSDALQQEARELTAIIAASRISASKRK